MTAANAARRRGWARRPAVWPAAALVVLFHASAVRGQEASASASLATEGDVWVGQRAVLAVDLRVPGIFAGAPAFQMPAVPGVLLSPPAGSPVIGSEDANGTSMTVQRHEVSVFPRRGGRIEIPPLTVRLAFKRNPLDKDVVNVTVKTAPVAIDVKVPPGAEKLGAILSARGLKADESWDPQPGKAAVEAGTAFTRTIVFSAPGVPAMAFPPFPATRVDGLGVYAKPPEVLDHEERGTLLGSRRDVITYVCERPGEFTIPAARLTWWDLDARQLRTIDFPARTLVVARPAAAASPAPPAESGPRRPSAASVLWFGAVAALLAAFAFAARRLHLGPALRHAVAPFRPVHLQPLNPAPAAVASTRRGDGPALTAAPANGGGREKGA